MERSYASHHESKPVIPVSSWLNATNPGQDSEQFLTGNMLMLLDAIHIHLRHLNISKEQLLHKGSWSPFLVYRDAYGNTAGQGNEVEQVIAKTHASTPSLAPIEIQKLVPHHPYIDLMPFPGFRQSILEQLRDNPHSISQIELCQDMENGGLRLWGQYPWRPDSYELMEWFAAKWGYLFLRDVDQAIKTTNFWRKQRNEQPLKAESFGNAHSGGRYRARFRDLQLVDLLGNDS
jgi:hypothetical protein